MFDKPENCLNLTISDLFYLNAFNNSFRKQFKLDSSSRKQLKTFCKKDSFNSLTSSILNRIVNHIFWLFKNVKI